MKFKPTVILGWMYGGNIFAFFCKLFVPFTPLYIGIRASNMDNRRYKFQKYFNKWISIFASGAIYNSYQGAIYRIIRLVFGQESHVIFNAIDSNKFRPNRVMSAVVKKSHKILLDQSHIVSGSC